VGVREAKAGKALAVTDEAVEEIESTDDDARDDGDGCAEEYRGARRPVETRVLRRSALESDKADYSKQKTK